MGTPVAAFNDGRIFEMTDASPPLFAYLFSKEQKTTFRMRRFFSRSVIRDISEPLKKRLISFQSLFHPARYFILCQLYKGGEDAVKKRYFSGKGDATAQD